MSQTFRMRPIIDAFQVFSFALFRIELYLDFF